MAIVGLLDWDLTRWKQPTVFNLELMKLAYYHKVIMRDIVQMEQRFDSSMCTKVFIQKDYEDYDYPQIITSDPKVLWRGLALSEGVYKPMDLEIEQCPADATIYENFAKYYRKDVESKTIYKTLMSASHLRLTLDGLNPFPDWNKQLTMTDGRVKHIIFHDKDLRAVSGIGQIIRDLGNEYGRANLRVGFKFPLIIETADELWDWGRMAKTNGVSNFNLQALMPDEVIDQLTPYKQQLTYYIKSPNFTTKTFIESLPKIFMQAMYLSSHGITVLLKIDREFLLDQRWYQFVDLFNAYIKSSVAYRYKLVYCCFTFCKYAYDKLNRDEKIDLFYFIKQQNEDLFDLLYGLEYATYENGIILPHMYTTKEIIQGGGYGGYLYQRANQRKDQSEQFNYAELIRPDSVYLE